MTHRTHVGPRMESKPWSCNSLFLIHLLENQSSKSYNERITAIRIKKRVNNYNWLMQYLTGDIHLVSEATGARCPEPDSPGQSGTSEMLTSSSRHPWLETGGAGLLRHPEAPSLYYQRIRIFRSQHWHPVNSSCFAPPPTCWPCPCRSQCTSPRSWRGTRPPSRRPVPSTSRPPPPRGTRWPGPHWARARPRAGAGRKTAPGTSSCSSTWRAPTLTGWLWSHW